ncbi:MAG: glutaredoxin family protein [Nitrososphaerales archaeon]
MNKITIITKAGCHICESTIEDLKKLSSRYNFELETIDILNDDSLFDEYWIKVPVVRLDGRDIFEVEDIALPEIRMKKLDSLLSKLKS